MKLSLASAPVCPSSCVCVTSSRTRTQPISTACAATNRPSVAEENSANCTSSRREAACGLALAALFLRPAQSQADNSLRYGTWDGKSAAEGSCAIGDDGIECRKQLLGRDRLDTGSYGSATGPKAVSGGAVADMSDEYVKATIEVADLIQKYAALEPFDPARPKLLKTLKQDGGDWASKYARGGNTRKQSARKFLIAFDAIQGHVATSGMAPMAKPKLDAVLNNVQEAKDFLTKGR